MENLSFEINNLTKIYKSKKTGFSKTAIDNISLQVPKGSFFGLLGPNGAGKSTLINIIAGLVNKTSGSIVANGYDLDKNPLDVRRTTGIVPQEVILDPFFTLYETLEFYAGYFGVKKKDRRTEELLKALSLWDKKDVKPRALSGGMKRRLLIAKALVNNPQTLILDEPTAGVDVDLRQQLWDYVKVLNKNGTTVILTTHYLEEAQQLCDDIAIINHGKVVANDRKDNLLNNFGGKIFKISLQAIANRPFEVSNASKTMMGQGVEFSFDVASNMLLISQFGKNFKINDVFACLQRDNFVINDVETEQNDLEDIFKTLVAA